MAARLFRSTPTRQKQVEVKFLVDEVWKEAMNMNSKDLAKYMSIVERHYRRAMVVVAEKVKANISMMNAVATGFMRSHVVTSITVNMNFPNPSIVGKVGTQAWYDILVHEGLGRHGSGEIPAEYLPTPEQLAIVPTIAASSSYWKPSPKIPRPFIREAIKQTRSQVTEILKRGFKEATIMYITKGKKRGGKPTFNILGVLNSASKGL